MTLPTPDLRRLLWEARWRRDRRRGPPVQVFNASGAAAVLPAPASSAAADAVRAGWAPWVAGQVVPLLWESVPDDDECEQGDWRAVHPW